MKRISIGLFLTFLGLIIFSACQENVYMDWKLVNDRFYTSLEDSMKYYASEKYTSLPDSVKKITPPMQKDLATGIYYKPIYPGYSLSRQPSSNSQVYVSFKGILVDGLVFDNYVSNPIGIYMTTPKYSSWGKILTKFHTGAHLKMFIPSKQALDTISTDSQIPPNSVLIYDVTLLDSKN